MVQLQRVQYIYIYLYILVLSIKCNKIMFIIKFYNFPQREMKEGPKFMLNLILVYSSRIFCSLMWASKRTKPIYGANMQSRGDGWNKIHDWAQFEDKRQCPRPNTKVDNQ